MVEASHARQGAPFLTTRHRADDHERFVTAKDRLRQRTIWRVVGEILLARIEPDERPATLGHVIADRPAQDRVGCLERVEHGLLRDQSADVDGDFAVDAGERSEMRGKSDANHAKVCTSTERTGGRA